VIKNVRSKKTLGKRGVPPAKETKATARITPRKYDNEYDRVCASL
jgi:hypothetical protein